MLTAFPALVSAIAAVYLTPPNEMPHETRVHQSSSSCVTRTRAPPKDDSPFLDGRMSSTHVEREQQLHQHNCAFAPSSAPHPLRSLRALVTFSNLQNILERQGRKRFQPVNAYGGDRRAFCGGHRVSRRQGKPETVFFSQNIHSSLLARPAMCSNETQLLCSHVARNCCTQ